MFAGSSLSCTWRNRWRERGSRKRSALTPHPNTAPTLPSPPPPPPPLSPPPTQAGIEAQLRQRLELQAAHKDYQELKARKAAAEREEEEQFRRQMMDKFAEDDRIEQMNAQKRRMKQLGAWVGGCVHIA